MYYQKCRKLISREGDITYVNIIGNCRFSGNQYKVKLRGEHYLLLEKGVNLKPIIGPPDMEFLLSGISPKAWDSAFGKTEIEVGENIIPKSFVTNATSKSIAFYVTAYLNNQGYTKEEITKLKERFGIKNRIRNYITSDEIRTSFANQSAHFLSIFEEINTNYKNFLENLSDEEFDKLFKRYKSRVEVLKNWKRRVFHNNLNCEYMRSNYSEEIFHKNTGVFIEEIANKEPDFYEIDESFLIKLGMSLCKPCSETKNDSQQNL